jgi:hypothetical protein
MGFHVQLGLSTCRPMFKGNMQHLSACSPLMADLKISATPLAMATT